MKISVIGLGKLGACYAAFYADGGFIVTGVDTDPKKVKALAAGIAPVLEPELAGLISKNKKRLSATMSIEEAVLASDATFIIVPTPSLKDGSFSVEYVTKACVDIGKALRKKDSYHLISLVSTVLPGDSREHIIPALEKSSRKKCGIDFGYCYNPSLIALGDIIGNLTHPDFLFLGAFDQKSGDTLAKIYRKLYPDRVPERMSIESVELAKIALNSYVTMKITFANLLGSLSEEIPHANVDDITTALGKDKRIGSVYFKSGLGYGGPCFPRDNYAFAHMAKKRGVRTPLALATHEINTRIPAEVAERMQVLAVKNKAKHIGFLGLSYKPRTTITEESQALTIAKLMRKKGYEIVIYEPLDLGEARAKLGSKATYADSLHTLVTESDIIFVSNKDDAFAQLPALVKKTGAAKVIVDPWSMFDPKSFGTLALYRALGRPLAVTPKKHR